MFKNGLTMVWIAWRGRERVKSNRVSRLFEDMVYYFGFRGFLNKLTKA